MSMAKGSEAVEIEVGDRAVRISNPDRVYFPDDGRHQARPRPATTWRSATASSTRCGSGRACCTGSRRASPARRCTRSGCRPGRPPWLETVRLHFPRYGRHADELCVTELAQVIWAVQMSTVEFHPWNSRRADTEKPDEWRIDLDPMPRVRLRDRSGASPTSPTRCSTSSARSAGRRPRAAGAARVRPDRARRTASRTCAGRRWRSPARSSGGPPTTSRRRGGARTATRRAVRRLQPERPRPHDRGGVLGARRARRHACRRRSAGTRSTTSTRRTSPSPPCPQRFAELGDLHAGIDDAVFAIDRCWSGPTATSARARTRHRSPSRKRSPSRPSTASAAPVGSQ